MNLSTLDAWTRERESIKILTGDLVSMVVLADGVGKTVGGPAEMAYVVLHQLGCVLPIVLQRLMTILGLSPMLGYTILLSSAVSNHVNSWHMFEVFSGCIVIDYACQNCLRAIKVLTR